MKPFTHHPVVLTITVCFGLLAASVAQAQPLTLKPDHPTAIYALGEKVGWTVEYGKDAAAAGYTYTVKKNTLEVIASGKLDPAAHQTRIETSLNQAGMLFLDVAPVSGTGKHIAAGAAVAPTQLRPVAPRPADFDAFWAAKIKQLEGIPAEPVLTPGDSGKPGVEYWTIRLNNINGAHVYGQLAKPARPGRYPAMLVMQWASPPYPLQKAWVTDHAAEGWLVLNVEPHDVPCDMPAAFYAALPQMIKSYNTIYDDERDRNYFLQMYLGDYRAMDYLAARPDWDGKVLVATGTSMGGQQSFAVAGLHPKVTHMIVHVPAGADSNGELHDHPPSYPNWNVRNPKVAETGLYFDTVNFASHIKATCLVSMGFVDTTCPAIGVWTAFNQIPGRKEPVPLPDSPHNHLATVEQQRPYTERSAAWFATLVHDQEPDVNTAIATGGR